VLQNIGPDGFHPETRVTRPMDSSARWLHHSGNPRHGGHLSQQRSLRRRRDGQPRSRQIIGIIFAPLLAMRFGKKTIVITGFLLSVIVNFAFYFLGKNDIVGMLVLTGVMGWFTARTIPLVWAIFADVVDFGEWKLGYRATGIVFATIGFGLKSGLAFGARRWAGWKGPWVITRTTSPNSRCKCCASATASFRRCLFLICAGVLFRLWLNKQTTQQVADELALRRSASAGAAAAAN